MENISQISFHRVAYSVSVAEQENLTSYQPTVLVKHIRNQLSGLKNLINKDKSYEAILSQNKANEISHEPSRGNGV